MADAQVCSVEGCGQPKRKRTWCGSHYAQWWSTGEVKPFTRKWATERVCVVCGVDVPAGSGRRKHCGNACQAADSWHKGQRASVANCAQCGEVLNLGRDENGRLKRSDTKMCRRCKQDAGKYGFTVAQLAARDGVACRICGDDVDLSLVFPDEFRASVDHVSPRSRGGSNDPENLQLTHLWCNQVKSDREGFSLMTQEVI